MRLRGHSPTVVDIRAAAERVRPFGARTTPLVPFEVPGKQGDVLLKLEGLQPTGSFKIRGMANALSVVDPADLREGVWTASAGNAAQGLAWAARRMGVACRVVLPDTAPATKRRGIERLGAKVQTVPFDEWLGVVDGSVDLDHDGRFVHPFADHAVMAGNGTIGLEIIEQMPDVRSILVPWGGGGLACGIALTMRAVAPDVRVFACEFAPNAPLSASLEHGLPTTVATQASFIDGIGAPWVLPEMYALAERVLDGAFVTTIEATKSAVAAMVDQLGIVSEGAGAVPVAVALGDDSVPGPSVCIVSGRNLDSHRLREILGG